MPQPEEPCRRCDLSPGQVHCGRCNGRGSVPDGRGGRWTCRKCNGTGWILCPTCGGRGTLPRRSGLDLEDFRDVRREMGEGLGD